MLSHPELALAELLTFDIADAVTRRALVPLTSGAIGEVPVGQEGQRTPLTLVGGAITQSDANPPLVIVDGVVRQAASNESVVV